MAFFGDIRLFAGSVAPAGWALCDGSILSVDGNEELLGALGYTYGFGVVLKLPDLRGCVPVHVAFGLLAQLINLSGGSETVTLLPGQIVAHSHVAGCSGSTENSTHPSANILANTTGGTVVYHAAPGPATLAPGTVGKTGGGLAHPNIEPYLAVNYIMCVSGGIPPA